MCPLQLHLRLYAACPVMALQDYRASYDIKKTTCVSHVHLTRRACFSPAKLEITNTKFTWNAFWYTDVCYLKDYVQIMNRAKSKFVFFIMVKKSSLWSQYNKTRPPGIRLGHLNARLFMKLLSMMTSSNGNIFRVIDPLCGEFTGPGEFPAQRPETQSFDVFFDLRLNKQLREQPWGWWFETPSWSLWRHVMQNYQYSFVSSIYITNIHAWLFRSNVPWIPLISASVFLPSMCVFYP